MPQPVRLRAVVADVIDHAPGLRSLILVPERPAPRFRPGQFLHLALDPWDPSAHWPDSRPFSIASPPDSRDLLRITVSRVGRFTERVMQAQSGDTVWLKLPYGEFVVASSECTPAVLVAGGTGIAPFISLVTSVAALRGPVRLLYGVRRPELLIYGPALDAAAQQNSQFAWTAFAEAGELEGAQRGRFSPTAVLESAESTGLPSAAVYYLSGPPEMVTTLRAALSDAGVEDGRIRTDSWT